MPAGPARSSLALERTARNVHAATMERSNDGIVQAETAAQQQPSKKKAHITWAVNEENLKQPEEGQHKDKTGISENFVDAVVEALDVKSSNLEQAENGQRHDKDDEGSKMTEEEVHRALEQSKGILKECDFHENIGAYEELQALFESWGI